MGIQRYRDGINPKFEYLQNMRACTEKDFNDRNYTLDATLKLWVSQNKFLCFDTSVPGKYEFGLKNFYSAQERRSFQINAATCNSAVRKTCRSEAQIRELMSHFLFNVHIIQQRTQLGRTGTTDMLQTQMIFHSQFVLEYDKYRDNNNYVRPNSLQFTINRWSLDPEEFQDSFLDSVASPPWVADDPYIWRLNVTRDGGSTFKFETYRMVFGVYFFLSEDKVEQFKNLSNISEVIAIIEGVAGLAILFVSILPTYINQKQLEAKTIRYCYFDVDTNQKVKNGMNLPAKPMKFSCRDKFSTFKRKAFKILRYFTGDRSYKSWYTSNQLTYLRAFDLFRSQFNLFQLI